MRELVVRDADADGVAAGRIRELKFVQVVVGPAHRILEGDVEVPEGVAGGHLDATPDGRLDLLERDLELEHLLACASVSGRRARACGARETHPRRELGGVRLPA